MKKLLIPAMVIAGATLFAGEAIPLKKEMFSSKQAEISTFMGEDGLTSIILKTVTNSDAAGNKYMDIVVKLPEILDLTGKGVAVTVKTDTPDVLRGFYFRAYNQGEKDPAWSFLNWNSPLTDQYQRLTLFPKTNSKLSWESQKVSGSEPTRIDRFGFHAGTPKPNAEMSLSIRSIEIIDNPYEKAGQAISGFEYAGLTRSNFSRNPEIIAADSDGRTVIQCHSTAPAEYPQFNCYDALSLAVKPIDLTGKTVKFGLRGTDNVNALYVRFYKDKSKKPTLSFVRSGAPPADWTTYQLKGGESGDFTWQAAEVDGGDFSDITRIDFIFSTPKRGETFGIEVRDLTVE